MMILRAGAANRHGDCVVYLDALRSFSVSCLATRTYWF